MATDNGGASGPATSNAIGMMIFARRHIVLEEDVVDEVKDSRTVARRTRAEAARRHHAAGIGESTRARVDALRWQNMSCSAGCA
tara:strand:+ start:451 stop:702 length:252 start_codon:yes stop_codon:yes gene_type:complete